MNTRALLLSGLIAGVLMGLFSELPILSKKLPVPVDLGWHLCSVSLPPL
jgi:hypothetical protein